MDRHGLFAAVETAGLATLTGRSLARSVGRSEVPAKGWGDMDPVEVGPEVDEGLRLAVQMVKGFGVAQDPDG